MSQRHKQRKKTKKAARDLLENGATIVQLDRLFHAGLISVRVYDKLANPILDQFWEPSPDGKRIVRSVRLEQVQ